MHLMSRSCPRPAQVNSPGAGLCQMIPIMTIQVRPFPPAPTPPALLPYKYIMKVYVILSLGDGVSSLCTMHSPLPINGCMVSWLCQSDNALDTTQDWDSSAYSQSTGGYVDTSFMSNARKGIYSSSDEEGGGVEGDSEEGDEAGGLRRSKRVTKGQTLQWWKSERTVYVDVSGTTVGIVVIVITITVLPQFLSVLSLLITISTTVLLLLLLLLCLLLLLPFPL